jgi:hypothetical protein
LNEEQYRLLCEACDRVLLANDSTIERVSIKWLHVIREHPVFLINYVDLFQLKKNIWRRLLTCWKAFHNKLRWLRHLAIALKPNQKNLSELDQLPADVDVLFVSHLLNASQAGQEEDFYFGEIPNQLVAQGYKVAIVLINHSGQSSKALNHKWNLCTVERIVLPNHFRVSELVAIYRRLKLESLRLEVLARKESFGLLRRVIKRASQEALSDGTLTTLRFYEQMRSLAFKLKPKTIVVTHEGHAWERMAFAAARSAVPEVKCIGYQHAALFRLQHAIRRSLTTQFNPDQILTVGDVSMKQLKLTPGLEGIPIAIIGSNRSPKNTLVQTAKSLAHKRGSYQKTCLVIPEGIASECYLLFEFSIVCAQALPEIKFIWRLHPILTFESLVSHYPMLKGIPSNIELSCNTLEEDIGRSRWSLYRGTTAIVQATVAGLKPIYLASPGELTIDPLYELEVWRETVVSILDFTNVINSDSDADSTCLKSNASKLFATQYCKNFFKPIDLNMDLNFFSHRHE